MQPFLDNRRSGQTIIEMVVALSVLTIGFLGIVALLNSSLGLNRVVTDNYRATYLASEGIEIIKNIVINNDHRRIRWCAGLPPGSYELDYRLEAPEFGSYDCTTAYPFLTSIFSSSTNPLLFHPDTHLYDYDVANSSPTIFYRTVTLSPSSTFSGDDDMMIVQSIVRWKDKTGNNEVNLIDYLYNPSSTTP